MQRRFMWPPLTLEKGKIICNFLFPFSPQLSGVTNVVFSRLNVEEVTVIAAVFILPWRCAARSNVFLLFFQPPRTFHVETQHPGPMAGQGRTAGWVAGYRNGVRWDSTSLLDTENTHILKGDPCGCSHTKEGGGGGGWVKLQQVAVTWDAVSLRLVCQAQTET